MPRIVVFNEIPNEDGDDRAWHIVPLPSYGEKGYYITAISFDYFSHGKLKGASKRNVELGRDRCCWGPTALYHSRSLDDFKREIKILEKYIGVEARRTKQIKHDSLWGFYKYIGFDHKKRRYV